MKPQRSKEAALGKGEGKTAIYLASRRFCGETNASVHRRSVTRSYDPTRVDRDRFILATIFYHLFSETRQSSTITRLIFMAHKERTKIVDGSHDPITNRRFFRFLSRYSSCTFTNPRKAGNATRCISEDRFSSNTTTQLAFPRGSTL